MPDNDYTAEKLHEFFALKEEGRAKRSAETRTLFEKHYQWDKTAQMWADYFDSVDIKPREQTWLAPPKIHRFPEEAPQNLSTRQLAQWLIVNVLGEPERLNSYFESRLVRDLNYGISIQGTGDMYLNEDSYGFVKPDFQKFTVEEAYSMMAFLCARRNEWEQTRIENIR